jgi:hypothetical protein
MSLLGYTDKELFDLYARAIDLIMPLASYRLGLEILRRGLSLPECG